MQKRNSKRRFVEPHKSRPTQLASAVPQHTNLRHSLPDNRNGGSRMHMQAQTNSQKVQHTPSNFGFNININRSVQVEKAAAQSSRPNYEQNPSTSTTNLIKRKFLKKKHLSHKRFKQLGDGEDASDLPQWEENSSETSQERIERLKQHIL